MASFVKVNALVENLAHKAVALNSTITIALTNTAHTSTWDELADLTQISYTNLSARTVFPTSSAQTAGTYKLVLPDLTLTATGAVGPFQYIYLYDDASTTDKLICYYDYGSAITMASTDTFKIDMDSTNGVLTIS